MNKQLLRSQMKTFLKWLALFLFSVGSLVCAFFVYSYALDSFGLSGCARDDFGTLKQRLEEIINERDQ